MSALFNPLKIGSTTLSNRLGMSALTRNRSSNSIPNDIMLEYYVQRAGLGLIVSEGVLIEPQGTEWQNAPGIWNDEQVAGWKKITDAVHAAGSKMYAQLWHLGRANHPQAPWQIKAGEPVYAPSAIAARGGKFRFIEGQPGYAVPTALEDPMIMIPKYKRAAINAKAAGFDGVEIHAANGYLIHEFLDSTANKRTDKWGGSAENRARFALEVVKAVQDVWGPDVAIKLSPAGGYNDMGMPLEETIEGFGYLLHELEKLRLAYVTLVRYSPYTDPEYDGKKRGTVFDVPATFPASKYLPTTPLFINAGVTPAEAESGVESNTIAGAFFGVPALAHPDLWRRIKYGKPLDNAPDFVHVYGSETVDPAIGYTDYKPAVYAADEV